MVDLNERPTRRGLIYCSPWCGRGCTVVEFDTAGVKAKALADRLGKSWEPYVWENMGWHYAAITKSGFHMMEHDDHYSLTTGTRFSSSADTPEEAIQAVLEAIKSERDGLSKLYKDGVAAISFLRA